MNFRDCFQIVRAQFLGLFSDSLDRIFRTIFGLSRTVLNLVLIP